MVQGCGELDCYGAVCLFRLISNAFIADEDAWAICKLLDLSSLSVSGTGLLSVSRLTLDTGEHQLAIPPNPNTSAQSAQPRTGSRLCGST